MSQKDWVAAAALILLAFSFLLGGASHQHALRVSLLELIAIPILSLAALRLWDEGDLNRRRLALGVLGAAAALPLIQSVPLPPQIWTSLPGREQSVLGLDVAGLDAGWSPLSVTPDQTWRSFLALLPPAAAFLAVLAVDSDHRRRISWSVPCLVLAGVALALLQLMVGEPFYLWEQTTRGTLTGFFSNRNHLATSCLMALPFCGALIGIGLRSRDTGRRAVFLGAVGAALLLIALAATRSRFGVVMALPALGGAAAIVWMGAGRARPGRALTLLAAAAGAAVALVIALGAGPVLDRFDTDGAPEGRFERWPTVADAAQSGLPVGWGFGAFDVVYRAVEPPTEVDETYLNRAHNDYLETWLEGGWPSIAVLIAFLTWFVRRMPKVWRGSGSTFDLARAGSVAIFVVLVHSAADYPMRTLTIACLFAVCAALVEVAGTQTTPRTRGRRDVVPG